MDTALREPPKLECYCTSTPSGDGRIILAKFKSFLGHIVDKHDDLDDPLFNKCAHGEIEHREWLDNRTLLNIHLLKAAWYI